MKIRFTVTATRQGNSDVPGTRLQLHVIESSVGRLEAVVEGEGFEVGKTYEAEITEVAAGDDNDPTPVVE